MKSIWGTIDMCLVTSARKGTLPFSTATRTTPSSYAAEISPASRCTPLLSSSAEISVSGVTRLLVEVLAEGVAQHGAAKALAQAGQLGERLAGLASGVGIALFQHGHDDLLEEAGLSLGGRLVHAQVPGLDAELHEPGGDMGRRQGVVVVVGRAPDGAADDDPVALELFEVVGLETAAAG